MRKALFIMTATALILFLLTIPVLAAEEGDVGCATVTVGEHGNLAATTQVTHMDPGTSATVVGHYMWLQFAHTPNSLNNIVSHDLDPYATGEQVTMCTDYVASGVIPTGPGSATSVTILNPATDTVAVVEYSTLTPHPELVDAWILDNGMVIL